MGEGSDVLASAAMTGNPYLAMGDMALKSAQGGSAGPSTANNKGESVFGGGGFSVIFGDGNKQSTSSEPTATTGAGAMGAAAVNNMAAYLPYVAMILGAAMLWKLVKKSK